MSTSSADLLVSDYHIAMLLVFPIYVVTYAHKNLYTSLIFRSISYVRKIDKQSRWVIHLVLDIKENISLSVHHLQLL